MNNDAKQSIAWGIIGCGNVTELKSGPAFNKVPNSSLVAVMRRDSEKVKDYAERHGVPKCYTDASALINDPAVNAIYIATPPKYHEAYTIEALRAGKPVYVEKPMSVNTASCLRMQAVAEETGVKLCVAHYRRALPMFNRIKQLLEEGVIGKIRTVNLTMLQPDQSSAIAHTGTNWRVDPEMAGAGLFFDLAPHQLDLMMYFFSKAMETHGLSANQAGLYKAEDVVTGIMRLENDILFNGQWCFTVAEGMEEDMVEINGSAGKISFPVFGYEVTIQTGNEKKVLTFEPPAHIQQPMIAKVVRYFLGKGDNPCSAADAILSMVVMDSFVK
ncbi:MAG: Gfo/Idh/MocA family oxidoreductase [Sediminibacterium sp.]|nr:Gfo/Idh/MocA family oxidoreductase [Sediminibacterium sp.]MDP1812178.1 Gfo/Idh/MocA family oxidoreductase [Sediminibacterium sp.]MDP3127097.1 Gfo/Idh/MocA family oxidoreductase [Sediminibacterium sp.]